MGTALSYRLTTDFRAGSDALFTIRYGRCTESPYVENGLWFVTIQHWDEEPKSPHTFIVAEEYARPNVFERFHRRIEDWTKIAHEAIADAWCEKYERVWQDVPVHMYTLPNASQVKYGYCRTQSRNSIQRELWFVAFRDTLLGGTPGTFVVDSVCTEAPFLDRMGNDHLKWESICWCRLDEGNEVHWEGLRTGTIEGGMVRNNSGFALDSPYLPFSLTDIPHRIQYFEDDVAAQFEQYKRDNSGIFNRSRRWENLTEEERLKFQRYWRQKTCGRILKGEMT